MCNAVRIAAGGRARPTANASGTSSCGDRGFKDKRQRLRQLLADKD
jgi:hypothetical protein